MKCTVQQSKEVGYFPELTQCAEDRLKDLSPNNRLLRKSVAAVPKDCLETSERNEYLNDITDWKDDMEVKEALLKNSSKPNHVIQPVRRASAKIEDNVNKGNEEKKEERIKSCDYESWDKYDAEKECLRLDVDEERRQEEMEKLERIEIEKEKARAKMSLEEAEIDSIKDYVCNLTSEEREVMATKEKDIGNEFYKTHHLDDALKHYTRSVYIHPTVSNYNNRAATYLKQCKFNKALADLNIVLQMDPNNVKARYRRAVAYQHKNEFYKALEDIRVVLAKEPHHVLARHFADRLREDCSTLPKKHRLRIRDSEGETHVEEVTEEEMLTNYKDKDFIEINEFGLPKIMCNCNGKYVDEPGIRHEDNIRFQHIRQRKRYEQQCSHQAIAVPYHPSNQTAIQPIADPETKPSLAGGGRRLDIVELDSIYEECEEPPQTACIVRDMRSIKEEKTNANLNIAQSANNSETVGGDHDCKSDKTAWNNNVKVNESEEDEEVADKDEKYHVVMEDTMALNEIPKRADIVEMMEAVEYVQQTEFETEDKDTWTKQWLQNSVSTVNNDFGKCMDLNESHNMKFGLGDACDMTLNENEIPPFANCRCSLNLDTLKPQNFLEKWNRIACGLPPEVVFKSKAALLKGVCPLHVPEVFSLNLNEAILTDIINCLCTFYEENYENEIILDYVRAVSKLQRFKIIICFVPDDVKLKMRNMFARMGPIADDVRRAFDGSIGK
ncbi:uncharacterized protein isoform X2 [Rhodnius prolixus]|uniref:uncharacterized protein isoform X2 n=1 Tax=Rhodnius prolixus TaxID=13249 RepID=UPI003D18CA12